MELQTDATVSTPAHPAHPAPLPSRELVRLERQARALALVSRGSALRTLRQSQGLRQQDLAKLAGCTEGMVSHLELNRRGVSPELAERLAVALGVLPPHPHVSHVSHVSPVTHVSPVPHGCDGRKE